MIRTSYYSNIRSFDNFVKVSISAKSPYEVDGHIKELTPHWDLIQEYKSNGDEEHYIKEYYRRVLNKTTRDVVMTKLRRICCSKKNFNVVLLCYEGKSSFCHRHLVSEWLREGGYDVKEL